jgi:hypothetical protein
MGIGVGLREFAMRVNEGSNNITINNIPRLWGMYNRCW